MPRITEEERARFHKYLDEAIDKMNTPKNAVKVHWSTESVVVLQKMVNVENSELELAMHLPCDSEQMVVQTECFDLINLNMMIIDNLRGNR